MASSAPLSFGWELLYRSIESEIKCDEDILLCFAHFVLISNNFKSIGLGESKTLDGTEKETEILPKGWNDCYAMRYKHSGRLYNLKCTKLDDGVMINLLRVDEQTVSLVQINTRSLNNNRAGVGNGTLTEMFPNAKELIDLIRVQLIDKVLVSKKSKEIASQTESNETSETRPRSNPDLRVNRPPVPPHLHRYPDTGVGIGVGEYDLYPFGRLPRPGLPPLGGGGGGMLYQPPRGGGPLFPGAGPGNIGVPPNSLPPGARFDPFRPPDVDRFPPQRRPNNPDNDELPPPGYEDMFM